MQQLTKNEFKIMIRLTDIKTVNTRTRPGLTM